jgi:hypothetical protein
MSNPWLFACLLGRHPKINHIHQNLRMALRLKITAHDSKGEYRFTFSCYKSGDDGIERPFVGLQFVEVIGIW